MKYRGVMCNEIAKVSDLSRSFIEILTATWVSREVLDNFQPDSFMIRLAKKLDPER